YVVRLPFDFPVAWLDFNVSCLDNEPAGPMEHFARARSREKTQMCRVQQAPRSIYEPALEERQSQASMRHVGQRDDERPVGRHAAVERVKKPLGVHKVLEDVAQQDDIE